MNFNIKNCDSDTICVWNIIEKQDFDIFDEDYYLEKHQCVVIPPRELKVRSVLMSLRILMNILSIDHQMKMRRLKLIIS